MSRETALLTQEEIERATPRFWKRVAVDRETGCWLWTGAIAENTPQFYLKGRHISAVRFALLQEGTRDLAPFQQVRRTCNQVRCVNPVHLVPLPKQREMRARMRKQEVQVQLQRQREQQSSQAPASLSPQLPEPVIVQEGRSRLASFEERLFANVEQQSGEDGCWLWMRKPRRGWRAIKIRDDAGVLQPVAKAVYTHYYGSIPLFQTIRRRCDNPACVRPSHLFIKGRETTPSTDTAAPASPFARRLALEGTLIAMCTDAATGRWTTFLAEQPERVATGWNRSEAIGNLVLICTGDQEKGEE